jgi:hypothetical protein
VTGLRVRGVAVVVSAGVIISENARTSRGFCGTGPFRAIDFVAKLHNLYFV